MLRAKTLIVSTVLNVATLLLSPGAHALLADLENRVGSAQQSLSLNKEQKSAICRVSLSDKAVMIASRFNITAENQNMPIIETQIFLFDEAVTSKQQDENSLIAERRYPTSGNACVRKDGSFYPLRSMEAVQTLKIEGNQVEITESYKCGLFWLSEKVENKTTCQF